MINLFEFQNKIEFKGPLEDLENFLDDIWKKRERSIIFEKELDKIETQQFLQILHKSHQLKSNKYIGVINFDGYKINLLPKIFYDGEREYSQLEINAIQNHILWWLSYCRKIKFPNYQTSLARFENDFFEILIYLFSKYTRELLSNSVYQQYENVEKELSFIKGRINYKEYINENIVKGRLQKINCIYDSFTYDNKFNRIIKYVTTLLFNITARFENKKYLREILFILDEVEDIRVTAEDCLNIQFNPMFGFFEIVRDYCYLFLRNSISFDYKNNLKLFAFLMPMEYVFEDFIFGFIDKEIEEIKAKSQVGFKYLDQSQNYKLKPDLHLETDFNKIIADTKYKIVYNDSDDPKKGILESDLYQMLAYAIRLRINEIKLFYPDTIKHNNGLESEIIIRDEFANGLDINIKAYQLPIINKSLFNQEQIGEMELKRMFHNTRLKLIEKLKRILLPMSHH